MQTPQPWPPMVVPPAAPRPRPAKRYSRFTALILSLFSPALYRDVARAWGGIGLLYMLLLFALSWVPVLLVAQAGLREFVRDDAPALVNQLPSVTINKGVVSIKEPEPHVVLDPESGEVLVYVDTSVEGPDSPEADLAPFVLGRSTLTAKRDHKTEVHDLSQIQYFYADKTTVSGWLDAASRWFAVAVYPFALLGSFVWGLIRLLIYGLIGLALAAMFNAKLDYPALMRLSAVAMTPGVLLDTLAWSLGWNIPFWPGIIFVIVVAYLAFAVKANAASPEAASGAPGFPMTPAPPYPQGYPPGYGPAGYANPGYPPPPGPYTAPPGPPPGQYPPPTTFR